MRNAFRSSPWLVAGVAVVALCAVVAVQAVRADETGAAKPQVFQSIQYTPTAKWDKSKKVQDQAGFKEHFDFVKGQFDKGAALLCGAYADSSGAVVILNTTAEDAKKFAAEDPFVKNGVVTAAVKPFVVVMSHAKWDVPLIPAPEGDKAGGASCGAGGKSCGK